MKKLIAVVGVFGMVVAAGAQDAKKSDEKRAQNPLLAALDANHDGELDATEVNNAPAALRKLDKDGDGKITRAEFRANRGGADKNITTDKAQKKAKKKKNDLE